MAAKVKEEKLTLWYEVVVLRDGKRAKRTGTIRATDPREGVDLIHEMAARWKRPVVMVDLYEIMDTGELDHVLQSTLGSLTARLNGPKITVEDDDESDGASDDDHDDRYGYLHGYPYGATSAVPNKQYGKSFDAWNVGTYFKPDVFATFRPADTEAK